jgi:hypothetical protein
VTEQANASVQEMKEEMLAMTHEVSAARDDDDEKRQIEAYDKTEALARRFKTLVDELPEADRGEVERTLGRRMIDLRREAAMLTKRVSGSKAERAVDAGVPFLLHRAPPKSIEPPRAAPTRHTPKFRVGAEVEAWCGKCRDLTDHHIVAMVGETPKQVTCVKCKSRHSYRTGPTARTAPVSPTPATQTPAREVMRTPVDPEVSRKAEQKRQLEKELTAAE